MGLPYVQLETDFIKRKAATIAAILRTKRQVVIGMASDLFDYVVAETASETKPPDGVVLDPEAPSILEGVMEWAGEPGAAFEAFVRAGVIERLEIGARVRGCERYRATWEKNRRRKPDGNRTVTGKKPDGTGPEIKRKSNINTPPAQIDAQAGSLRERLEAEFLRVRAHVFVWVGDHERDLIRVVSFGEDEIVRRWGNALRRKRFPTCDSVRALVQHWNAYATDEPAAGKPRDPRKDPVRAEDQKHPDEVGEIAI